jgi:hypothetical protein
VDVVLEGVEGERDLADRLEVVRFEHLSLHDREVDLDLVEPARVQGQVDEDEVRPAALEPLDRAATAVRGAVVDDSEDLGRRGVGLLGHHLPDEPVERRDPAARLGATEDIGSLDVKRGQVGERAAALVAMLDPLPARA